MRLLLLLLLGGCVLQPSDHNDSKKPVIPKITIDAEIKLIGEDILRLRKINNKTAKALLKHRLKQLRERLNEGKK